MITPQKMDLGTLKRLRKEWYISELEVERYLTRKRIAAIEQANRVANDLLKQMEARAMQAEADLNGWRARSEDVERRLAQARKK